MKNKREGFWKDANDPALPLPLPNMWSKPESYFFLNKLKMVEKSAVVRRYKGFSACRICGCKNGSEEFIIDEWIWPSGFSHYVLDHQVKPSAEFINFIQNK